jgi:hypothetical protein
MDPAHEDKCHTSTSPPRSSSAPSASPCPQVGLELGDRLSIKTGERGELLGGPALIAVGIAIASGIL